MTSTAFADLGLPGDVVASLTARGITDAFDIQIQAIPPALNGRDVCGRAPTGSGKTLAFGIPVMARVERARPHRPRALILTPTRELAAQIADELGKLQSTRKRSIATFYGGVGFGAQIAALRRGVDIAVACPGRLADLIRRGDVSLADVDIVVLDEADRMADMGFLPEVIKLLDMVTSDRQTMLFSATLDGAVDKLIKRYQNNPVHCEAAPETAHPDRTSHTFRNVRREERTGVAAELAHKHGSTVVFTRTKHGADRLAKQLQREGLTAVAIHGGRSQGQRDRALGAFSGGRAQVLVATDVAARGIHVDDVACVVHYDLPTDHKDYVHRSGRTGRAGAEGTVVALFTHDETGQARSIQRALGMPLSPGSDGGGTNRTASGRGRPSNRSGRRPQGGRTPKGQQTAGRGSRSSGRKRPGGHAG